MKIRPRLPSDRAAMKSGIDQDQEEKIKLENLTSDEKLSPEAVDLYFELLAISREDKNEEESKNE